MRQGPCKVLEVTEKTLPAMLLCNEYWPCLQRAICKHQMTAVDITRKCNSSDSLCFRCNTEQVLHLEHWHLGQDGVLVLDTMGLINDDVSPVELLEVVLLLDDHLIGGHHHIKFARLQLQLLVQLHMSQDSVNVCYTDHALGGNIERHCTQCLCFITSKPT